MENKVVRNNLLKKQSKNKFCPKTLLVKKTFGLTKILSKNMLICFTNKDFSRKIGPKTFGSQNFLSEKNKMSKNVGSVKICYKKFVPNKI